MLIRQGDVLLVRTTMRQATGTPVPAESGRHILMRGEQTGHHHSVDATCATLTRTEEGQMFLTVDELVGLTHQEHATLDVPPGVWQVTRQREYSPEAPRYVGD